MSQHALALNIIWANSRPPPRVLRYSGPGVGVGQVREGVREEEWRESGKQGDPAAETRTGQPETPDV